MANNRMWLVHKPSGKKALLAKHWGDVWYEYTGSRNPPFYSIQELFNETDTSTDFAIEYETLEDY